ncbi:MAG: ferredoxin-thioredoxin reductase catalytic domain-containing protein, partial [Promethearchaeota archaeon]
MLESLSYIKEQGAVSTHHVRVYALSTCGFCKKCLRFLHNHQIIFEYMYFDLLDQEVKHNVRRELKKTYNERVAFPFVVIDDDVVIVGFLENELKRILGLGSLASNHVKKRKTRDDVVLFTEMVAKHNGWGLNRDKEFYDLLIDGLQTNFNRYGYFSCPYRAATGVKEKDKDIICPCDYCKNDQDEFGHCCCGLYLTPEFYSSGKKTHPIPDRRPESLEFQ